MTMTTTTHPDTEIIVDKDVPLVRIIREFDAPPEKVFRAHADPELLVQWLGPRDLTMEIDRRSTAAPAASTATSTRREGEEYFFHGCFHEVRPNELIVQTFTFEGMPDHVALEKLVLEDLDGGRTRLVATSLVDSFEDRDAIVASGMETGIVEGYERLDELLAHVVGQRLEVGLRGGVGREEALDAQLGERDVQRGAEGGQRAEHRELPAVDRHELHRHEQQGGRDPPPPAECDVTPG